MKKISKVRDFFASKAGIAVLTVLALCIVVAGVVYALSFGRNNNEQNGMSQQNTKTQNIIGAGITSAAGENTTDTSQSGTAHQTQQQTGQSQQSQTSGQSQQTGQSQQLQPTEQSQQTQPTGQLQPTGKPQQSQHETKAQESTSNTKGTAAAGESTTKAGNTTADESTKTTEPVPTEAQPIPTETQPGRKDAAAILAGMTIEEKVSQMFIARCPDANAQQMAERYQPGGYILFARDFKNKTRQQVISTIEGYQQVSKIPMLIGVDEEGGKVNRISLYSEFRANPFMSPQELFSAGGYEMIRSDTREKSILLKSLGVNMNFAPVADVSQDAGDFIYQRTFGRGAEETSQYISNVVSVMKQQQVGSVLKHFPGYGNNSDTHTGIAYDNRSYESFQNSDFLPFRAGAAAGADAVLVAHNVVYCMDSVYPASLSENVHRILRDEIGFKGVIITDELSMAGVSAFADDENVAVLAVLAGNDLLCCTSFETQINAVINAVKSGRISESRINESVIRILNLKISLGII